MRDRKPIRHVLDVIASMRSYGRQGEVVDVTTDLEAEGFLVTCSGCGRQARAPFDPGDRVALCPECLERTR